MTTPTSPQRPSRKRAADYTGKQTEKLNEARKNEIIEASSRIALVNAEAQAAKEEIIDYTNSSDPLPTVEVRKAEVATPYRMIRVNADIDQMTYGREVIDSGDYDNPDLSQRRPAIMGPVKMYSFAEGQMYRVPREIAEHLNNLGYLSYMSNAQKGLAHDWNSTTGCYETA